ncbi:MAG TPA: hypothetical protein VH677_00465 [Nitrososphaera sp.]|jgi:hypothetical protein
MDAALEEELYDLLTLCIQQPDSPDNAKRKARVVEIGQELAADGGADAMESMFFSIEQRIQGEIGADARPYRAWWNGIAGEWKY